MSRLHDGSPPTDYLLSCCHDATLSAAYSRRDIKIHQACCETSCSFGSICHIAVLIDLFVPDALLRELLQQIIIKTRNGVLLVIPLIPTDFFCFLCWWRNRAVLRP